MVTAKNLIPLIIMNLNNFTIKAQEAVQHAFQIAGANNQQALEMLFTGHRRFSGGLGVGDRHESASSIREFAIRESKDSG